MEIHWKPQALRDLEAIEEYYQKVAPHYAEIFVDNILAATRGLEHSPRLGRMVPEIGDRTIREVLYRNYRIIYLFEGEEGPVEILTVIHGARQLGEL